MNASHDAILNMQKSSYVKPHLPPLTLLVSTPSGHQLGRLSEEQLEKARKRLSPRQRQVLIHKHAEAAHAGMTANGFRFNSTLKGTYVCVLGGIPVFHSDQKVFLDLPPTHMHTTTTTLL